MASPRVEGPKGYPTVVIASCFTGALDSFKKTL
jgi:hypothetical protein